MRPGPQKAQKAQNEFTRCWCSIPESMQKPSFATANAQLADHQRIRSFSIWTDGALAANGRHEESSSARRSSNGWMQAHRRAAAHRAAIQLQVAAREVCRRAAARRRHVDRGAGPELARARRADGRARGSVPDAHRRDEVRGREDARRSARGARIGAGGRRGRRAGRLPVVESRLAGADRPPRQSRRRGSCRSARIFAWVRVSGLEHLERPQRPGRVRVESSKPFRRAGDPDGAAGIGARDDRAGDGRRNSSRHTSFPRAFRRGRCSPTA